MNVSFFVSLLRSKTNISQEIYLGMRIPTSSVYLSDLGSGDPDVTSHDGVYSKYITGTMLCILYVSLAK